ncbi:hypothetical protein AlacWU_08031 [Aspergillus niger]|uniref:Uncharacterized protein n=2 Tax=Aspergillus niger TaxID=5061 RepID=A2Q9X3_ASPNC|nr:hypothetical protein An01g09420 [Aspergillus niger]GJP95132.1 hypothetical protein AlacWU_08031 [Aspergillus niger]CAK43992.1 hypothetical protein An01g09420 [Aspergillus niger]
MAQLTMQWSLVENQQQTEPLKYDYSISQSNWNYTNECASAATPPGLLVARCCLKRELEGMLAPWRLSFARSTNEAHNNDGLDQAKRGKPIVPAK